ncbi:MAG: hypothetical protein U5M23_03765 [Marinagarivorans sp.]|nr:hypothetical protein [Marinagarivorans sp.]
MSQHNAKIQAKPPTTGDNAQTWQVFEQKLDALLAYTQQLENTNVQLTQQLAQNEAKRDKLAQEYSQLRQQLDQISTQMQTLEEKSQKRKH